MYFILIVEMFKKIYYINLDHRKDRKDNVDSQLKKINFSGPVERINAAYGKNLDLDLIPSNLFTKEAIADTTNKKLINNTSKMTKGGMGVSLSQRWIYEKVLCSNDDYVLILEDDITIPDNFMEKLENKLKNIKEFDILFLGYHLKYDSNSDKHYDYPEKIWGLFGYIINKKAAKHLIEMFPITRQIDTEMHKIFKNLKVIALKEDEKLVLSPVSQDQSQFTSDIQFSREAFTDLKDIDWAGYFIIMVLVIGVIYLGVRR
jgi:GR25 family glycosyltransferase involved in LPS biosynthesis